MFLGPATMPTWYQLNCAKHAFKLKGHRVTVRLKSLSSMINILLFAKRQWESFNYIHTDIILCREVLFWMQDLLLVGWPSANAHIHSVWCWSHERKSKGFFWRRLTYTYHHQDREAKKEPPRQSMKFKPDSRGALNISTRQINIVFACRVY